MRVGKKGILPLLAVLGIMTLSVGCTPKTEYDDKEIARIETSYYGGLVWVDARYTRTFDFTTRTVTDVCALEESWLDLLMDSYYHDPAAFPDYENAEAYEAHLRTQYNAPESVSSFSKEQGEDFLERVISLGFYTWEEVYQSEGIDDGSWQCIRIYFTDGTMKTTLLYYRYPKHYEAVKNTFSTYLGTGMFWRS